MNTDLILNASIENIDAIYGGVRGTTLSSHRNMHHWQTIVDSGLQTIVELRDGDHTDRLYQMCEKYHIRYFAFPIDSHNVPNEVIATKLQDFFEVIDNGNFYIACAMGLHRTDLALSIYWVFHGADKGLQPPFLKGHIANGEIISSRLHNKVFRRLNSLYTYLSENNIIPIPKKETFNDRKRKLEEMKENLSQQEQENLIRFEVKDDHVFVHGYADLENREGYPVGDGIVFFSGKGDYHHELYIANTLTGKIRHLSTAGGRLLVDDDEIDYEAIEKQCKHGKNNARLKIIKYAGINRWDGFKNGLCAISWMLYPEGIYFADSDGFGGEDSNEENVYGIMDTSLQFIEPFRPINGIRMYLAKIRSK